MSSLTTNGGSPQTRSANKQNEITSISGATTPNYDSNGNMTGDETGKTFVYDAWNRLVAVKSGSTTLKSYGYDGLNRRVSETASSVTTDLFYSAAWQVLEEKIGGNFSKRYVWSPVYVDAMVLRDRDTDANGTLDERLWVMQDANFNVTALVNGSGVVVERNGYDPFGVQTVYDASYTVRNGGSNYDFHHGFQGMWSDGVSGLDEARMRRYSPTLAVWTSVDPTRYTAGDVDLYRFVGNAPIAQVDPTGLASTTGSISLPADKARGYPATTLKYDIDLSGCVPCEGDAKAYTDLLIKHLEKGFLGLRATLYDLTHFADPKYMIPDDRRTEIANLLRMWFRPAANREDATAKTVLGVYDKIAKGWSSNTLKIRCDKKCAGDKVADAYTKLGLLGTPDTIFLCPNYLDLSDNKRILTLIHELSHLYGGTADHGYFNRITKDNVVQYETRKNDDILPLTNAQLIDNADTYANFITAMGYLQMDKQ